MLEICTDHPDRHVLATAPTLQQAFEAIEALEGLTATQLARNCEGATDFWLRLAVLDDGRLVALSATRLDPDPTAGDDE